MSTAGEDDVKHSNFSDALSEIAQIEAGWVQRESLVAPGSAVDACGYQALDQVLMRVPLLHLRHRRC